MGYLLRTAVVVAACSVATAGYAARELVIGGGSITGIYYQAALKICNVVNLHGGGDYRCAARPALGSVFNINAVERGLLDFGICQSDRNWDATNGKGEWAKRGPIEGLRSVFGMYPETVLLVARADSGVQSVTDLKGKRVNLGNPGSGQRGNAEDVLRLYGIDREKDIRAEGLSQSEASRALVDGEIDAFFYTVGNPSMAVDEPSRSIAIRLIPIDSAAIRSFVSENPYYAMAVVPPGTYRGVERPVETLAVKATLVTRAELDEQIVYDVVRSVFENLDGIKASHAAFRDLEPVSMLQGLSAPLHPGAIRYYREQGWL